MSEVDSQPTSPLSPEPKVDEKTNEETGTETRTDSLSRPMIRHVYTQSGVFSDIENLSQPDEENQPITYMNSLPDRPRNRFYEITRQFSSEILSVFEEEDEEALSGNVVIRRPNHITYEQIQNFLVSFPLVLIPGLIFVQSFYLEMCLFIYLTVVVSVGNDRIVQNYNPKFFSKLRMILIMLFVVGNVILVSFVVYPSQRIYRNFIFIINSKTGNFAETFWMGVMIDFVGKLGTLFVKSVLIFLFHFLSFIPTFQKGKVLSLVEHLSFFYRNLIPTITLWLPYFLNQEDSQKVVCFVLIGVIFLFKFFSALLQFKEFHVLSQMFCCRKARVGRYITIKSSTTIDDADGDDSEEKPEECSVCREKFVRPVKLECSHVFCNECINHWMKKDKTCPLCRRPVKENLTFGSNGETSLIPLII